MNLTDNSQTTENPEKCSKTGKRPRFILFVGMFNFYLTSLPYSVVVEIIIPDDMHFSVINVLDCLEILHEYIIDLRYTFFRRESTIHCDKRSSFGSLQKSR